MSVLEKIHKARDDLKHVEIKVTMENGAVTKEERSSEGNFVRIDEDEDGTICGDGGGKKEQESEISPSKDACTNREDFLSNRQKKNRLYREALGYVVDLKPDLQMANVAKRVYLGSQDAAHDYETLTAHNITHIINCATGVRNIFEGAIKYLAFDVLDLPWANIEQHFEKCHEFINEAVEGGGNVLVHCNAGVSRSPTIVLSYIMRYNKMTLQAALDHVNAIRKVSPNPGFMQQLKKYEVSLQR